MHLVTSASTIKPVVYGVNPIFLPNRDKLVNRLKWVGSVMAFEAIYEQDHLLLASRIL